METKAAKHILTVPDNEPYPENLNDLLTIEKAAVLWNVPAVTIRAKCKAGFFGNYARKMGGQWILTSEAMHLWRGPSINGQYQGQIERNWTKLIEAQNMLAQVIQEAIQAWGSETPKNLFKAAFNLEAFLEDQLPKQDLKKIKP